MMKKELDFDDILYFPDEILMEKIENDILVISVATANWIVLKNEIQLTLFGKLRNRLTVGEIMEGLESEEEVRFFKSLLASILSRKFAGIGVLPTKELFNSFKKLNIGITNACNLRCKHCFMKSGEKFKNELTLNNWIGILSDFKSFGGVGVTFSGGEPLMFQDFDLVLKHAHTIGLSTTILSNGTLWSEKTIEKLSPYIDEVQFSIDGVDEKTHSYVRGEGYFQKVVDTVIKVSCLGVKTSVATTFTYENLKHNTAFKYKELVNAIQSRTENEILFKLSKKILPGRDVNFIGEDNEEYLNHIKGIEEFANMGSSYQIFMENHTPNLVASNCGFGGISINADGSVYFCNRIYEVESYGNILEQPISYFLEKGKEMHIQTSVDNVEPCSQCSLRYICDGGCRIDDFDFAGKLEYAIKPYRRINCTEEKKRRLKKRMIDSFDWFYNFDI